MTGLNQKKVAGRTVVRQVEIRPPDRQRASSRRGEVHSPPAVAILDLYQDSVAELASELLEEIEGGRLPGPT